MLLSEDSGSYASLFLCREDKYPNINGNDTYNEKYISRTFSVLRSLRLFIYGIKDSNELILFPLFTGLQI